MLLHRLVEPRIMASAGLASFSVGFVAGMLLGGSPVGQLACAVLLFAGIVLLGISYGIWMGSPLWPATQVLAYVFVRYAILGAPDYGLVEWLGLNWFISALVFLGQLMVMNVRAR